ncbi:TetR/AcrR family transcriptional regulator [Beijerinckia indica]|uniref:Transcriptional regulator, TetR family n=1 Tax=Beijerinckia indica subsp. indica (strain ATCC 9039 / DSM 1715 / NCIMB 8712) TaxID=395963 RepID=B2IKI1_BEII9|nr:TetR/AcrR family transcriptional regulator [Beijerinckia indica]ACB96461.1 transcriptional regulator, TetR family [Beijerinckia indica subsp. indica ATCC 9039]
MARPREFDRDAALDRAIGVFWGKGYAATSTEELVEAMGIGRQSLYNAFGDKRHLFLEALGVYHRRTIAAHLQRLSEPVSPVEGILNLLIGLIPDDDNQRSMGCMGIGTVSEFGASDPDICALGARALPPLTTRLAARIREGQALGELDPHLDPDEAAGFVHLQMTGIQLGARGGVDADALRAMVRFAVDRLRAS